jgi:hypothetical protein
MPEYIMGRALSDRAAARAAQKMMQDNNMSSKTQHFELIHGYFVNIGGYYLDFTPLLFTKPKPDNSLSQDVSQSKEEPTTNTTAATADILESDPKIPTVTNNQLLVDTLKSEEDAIQI